MADTIIETTNKINWLLHLLITIGQKHNRLDVKAVDFICLMQVCYQVPLDLLESYSIVCLKSDLMLEKLRIFVLA